MGALENGRELDELQASDNLQIFHVAFQEASNSK
jgi:hypothetical protein